ncbi:MAG: response regulator [Planctomycetes bacterium]|nr:response regulator [Planctomycetota bacterium]MCB9884771.1 response regulator [Planctomycetota bacterium]
MTHSRRAHHDPRRSLSPLLFLSTTLLPLLASGAVRGQELLLAARAATAAAPANSAAHLQAQVAEARLLLAYDLPAAIELAQRCVDLAEAAGDERTEIVALTLLARAQAKNVGKDAAMATLARATAVLGDRVDFALHATVGHAYSLVHWSYDELPECLTRLRRAIYDADEAKDARLALVCEMEAVNVVGFAEEPLAVLDRLDEIAARQDDPLATLELRMLRADALIRKNEQERAESMLRELLADSERLGCRTIEAICANMLARALSDVDPEAAVQMIRRSVAAARAHGDREVLGLGLQGLAYLSLRTLDLDGAKAAIDESVATLAAMQMNARLYSALETAVSVASARGDEAGLRAASNQRVELDRIAAQHQEHGESDRFWRETEHLRLDLRATQRRHEAELAAMNARLTRMLLGAGGTVLVLGGLFALLLLRAKRRLEQANTQLVTQMAAAKKAQEERAALEGNLRQLERLDSIGLLAGGFAHDFNNILVGVKGNAQLLLLTPQVDAASRDLLDQIVASSDRAARLCKDILTYARADNETRQVVDLRGVLESLLPIARAGFGAGIEVDVALGASPLLVEADRSQLEQVFLNLLTNAHEAIGERGRIVIRVDERTIPGSPPTGHWFGEFTGRDRPCVAVSVADTGQGMTAETIRRIFDPFFSTRFPGRGIGLAAAFGILRRHHGVVEVKSEPGHGAEFVVYLPRAAGDAVAAPAQTPAQPAAAVAPAATRVLVVDDEPTVRNVVRRVLSSQGLTVTVVESGAAALQELDRPDSRFQLAVIDFTMPDMDGAALSTAIRRRKPALPIVLMSGHDESMVRSAAAPDCAFLAKPFDAAELLRVVGEATTTPRA